VRYRMTEGGQVGPPDMSGDVVTATVWFTLLVGIVFLVAGLRGRQHWLKFWGATTCLCCALYFLREPLGLMALLQP